MPHKKGLIPSLINKGFLLTLFVLPLIFNPWGFDSYEIPKNIFLKVLVSILAGGILIDLLSKKSAAFPLSDRARNFILLFLGIIGLSTFMSLRPEISFFGTYFRQGGVLNLLNYAVLFFVGLFYFDPAFNSDAAREKHFFKTIFWSGMLVSSYAILQKLGLDFYDHSITDIFSGRSFSTLGNPTSLGTALLFPLGSAAYLFTCEKKRWIYSGGFLAIFSAIVFSQSRGALLAILVCAGLLLLKHFQANKKALIALVTTGLLALVLFAAVFSSNTRSLSSRFTIWASSVEILKEYPIFGVGLENFSYVFEAHVQPEFFQYEDYRNLVDRPHNEFLEVWIHLGLPGLFLYLAYALYLLKSFWTSENECKRFSSLALLALLAANFFGFSLVTQFALAAAFLSHSAAQNRQKISWTWTPLKTISAFSIMLLLLVNLFFHVRLFVVDSSLRQAYTATITGNPEEMISSLDRAVRWGSMYGEVYNKAFNFTFASAKSYKNDTLLQTAVAMNDLAKAIQKNSLLDRLNEASLYELIGNTEEAVAIYKKANDDLATNPVLLQDWAELYYSQSRYEEALPLYEALLNLLPDWSESAETKRIFWKNHSEFQDILQHIQNTYETLGQSDAAAALETKIK